ncbi:Rid family hydrolase [Nocardioidaceae bacterium SCSIO 66511]|nr:Rid family hydrolase [Nocardioidaceae bacterium SCSIO 66511]
MLERIQDGGGFEEKAGYCRAVKAGATISVSGTIASAPEGVALADLDTYEQTAAGLRRSLEAVRELGGAVETVTRTRVYLAPGAVWQQMVRAHHEIFADARPANTTVYVSALIPPGALVEVELEAVTEVSR